MLEQIEQSLRVSLAGTLPGLQAQLRFAPQPQRPEWRAGHFPSDSRIAAGLLLLYPREYDVAVPLTVRASHLPRHAGQISLPGGAADPGETLAATALREASEEIGVDPAAVRILGELTPVHVVVSGFTLPSDRRRDRHGAGVHCRAGRGGRDPGSLARRSARRVEDRARYRACARVWRWSIPTSICSVTRSGARPR